MAKNKTNKEEEALKKDAKDTQSNEKMSVLPDEMQKNEHIRKAAELCERAAFTPEELLKYEASKEHIRIERAVREGTRRDALAEGFLNPMLIFLQNF